MIDDFRFEYRFLSNFYFAGVMFEGDLYPSSENAYQAAKCAVRSDREVFQARSLRPVDARRHGQTVTVRAGWDGMKADIMYEIVLDKFTRHPVLQAKLLATGDVELIEGNWWHDIFWGVCTGKCRRGPHPPIGENHLGRILVRVRTELQ